MVPSLLLQEKTSEDPEEIREELDDLEFQVYRMQDNLREIAKRWQVIGIEQTKENNWVIIYTSDDDNVCKIMLNDCQAAYRGNWDFSIEAKYKKDNTIHIGDIKGPENKGYGSICMDYLKETAKEQNIHYITGDLVKRDWDHLDRLIHFYRKHDFDVNVDKDTQSGEIVCNPFY